MLNFQARYVGFAPLAVDNSFGPATYNAVVATQRKWNFTVDGIVGPQVWSLICYPQMGPGG
ncbi:peptidoglycan-binding domain-containing protein [Psychromicrobium lacuslunae]|uniref:peptidoglycan-binding domain-containing protein n=1 Tax=Psychromicrobium lacuslunae TaxID=1618207 RepID=UPI0012FF2F3A